MTVRIVFAKEHMNQDWSNVICADEPHFVQDEQQLMMAIKTAYDKISIQQTNTLAAHMKHV